MKKVLFINGSLRTGSFNGQVAKVVEGLLGEEATVSFLNYSDVPLMNQDLEASLPASVSRVRQEVLDADFIWIFSPIYNFSIPGTVKNLLDWLSRALDLSNPAGPSAVHEKKVTVTFTGAAGYESVAPIYDHLLKFIRMEVVNPFVHINYKGLINEKGELNLSVEQIEKLKQQVSAVLAA